MRLGSSLPIFVVLGFTASLAGACSSGSGSSSSPQDAQVLDPTEAHYGNTDDEWGALFWQWVYQLPQPDYPTCNVPFQDPTGAHCADGQSGDVFFLAGTTGGTVVRDQCKVPSGKAIFFPILTFTADNAGIDPMAQLTDMGLQGYVQNQLDGVKVDTLSASFDGTAIPDLGRFLTKITQFKYLLPPEPNIYTCGGASGVTGPISPAYAAGYYVMLAPPAKGAHTLHFAGTSPATNGVLMVDVTYHFTVD